MTGYMQIDRAISCCCCKLALMCASAHGSLIHVYTYARFNEQMQWEFGLFCRFECLYAEVVFTFESMKIGCWTFGKSYLLNILKVNIIFMKI